MIVWVWVFFIVGDPTPEEPGMAYTQVTASPFEHDREPSKVEAKCAKEYRTKYPGHRVIESGWHRERVTVMGQ